MSGANTYEELLNAARLRPPTAALVLGSGLSNGLALAEVCSVSFAAIPGMAASTVAGHAGTVVLAEWLGQSVLVSRGRLHFYEGHPWERVARFVELAHELGAGYLVLTNAAGGIRLDMRPGHLMAIRDHFTWNRPHFYRLPGTGGVGGERPSPYSPELLKELCAAAHRVGRAITEGIYISVTGPTYETPSEIRAMRQCGGDAVGMSTAHEAETAARLGLPVVGLSLITNAAAGITGEILSHAEVQDVANLAVADLAAVLGEFVKSVSPFRLR